MESPSPVAALVEESQALERSGQIAAALQKALQAVELARGSGNHASQALALHCQGYIFFRGGEFASARRLADEALALAPPESAILTDVLLLLGLCATETDDLDGGENYYRRAANLARLQGGNRALTRSLHNLSAGIYTPRGQFDLAMASDEEALRIAQERGLPQAAIYPRLTLASNTLRVGQFERARALTRELETLVLPGSLPEGYVFLFKGELALTGGQSFDLALEYFQLARSTAENTGDPGLAIEARLALSRALRVQGNLAAALQWTNDAVAIASRINGLYAQCMARVERARVLLDLASWPQATDDLHQAMATGERCQATYLLARAALLLAALARQQQWPEARHAWRDAARRISGGGYTFLLEQERMLAFPLIAAHLSDSDGETAALTAALLEQLERLPPAPLHVTTLGGLEVRQGGRSLRKSAWGQRRAGELLALLMATPGHRLSTEQVAEALAPDKPAETAFTVVHHATSELRRILEPELPDRRFPSRYLEVTDRLVTLHLPSGSWLDFTAFEQAVRERHWEQALALYQGEFLPEYRYSEWAAAPREGWEMSFRAALLALAEQRLAGGDYSAALEFSRRLIALDPWHEDAVLAAMRACQGLNDLSLARRIYRHLEATLAHELGIEPQEALQAFYRSLDRRRRSSP